MSLTINIHPQGRSGRRISLNGSLDSNTAPELQDLIEVEISQQSSPVVLDFQNLDFLSSAGLRVIFRTRKQVTSAGNKFLLVNLQPQIRKVFEIIKALDGMNVFKDRAEMDAYLAAMQDRVKSGED